MRLHDSSNMHHSREAVVTRLTHVHVVIGMDLLAANLPSEDLDGSIGDDLIGVHV